MCRFLFLTTIFILLHVQSSLAQNLAKDGIFESILLKIDTISFNSARYQISYQGEKYHFFKSINNQDFCEITLISAKDSQIENIELLPSNEYTIIDSVRHFDEKYFRGKIKFTDLENSKYLSLIFSIKFKNGKYINYQIKLFPYTDTKIIYDNDQ